MDKFGYTKEKINIRDIKSSFILEKIFSFLSEKQFLMMIMYNKRLQNMLSISIEDYLKKSGKYKIGEKNGKGKEYIIGTNKLIFEGEYLNGKRNGKGKKYSIDGELEFEGEYLNGKKWNGKGKEYNWEGKLIFEGEYINGRRWNGKEYYKRNEISFEIEYLNGKKWNGKG